jgi:hypothetical protein
VYGLPLAEWSEQIIGVPEVVTPEAPSGEQNEPGCTPCCTEGGGVVGGAVAGGCVAGGLVAGELVAGGLVAGGEVFGRAVTGATVAFGAGVDVGAAVDGDSVVEGANVVETPTVVGTEGGAVVLLLDDAPATPAMRMTSATGTAIFAHSGQARTQPIGVIPPCACATTGTCCVCEGGTAGVPCVIADSGGYHLPSDACHHPGSLGAWSSGPRDSSLNVAPLCWRVSATHPTSRAVLTAFDGIHVLIRCQATVEQHCARRRAELLVEWLHVRLKARRTCFQLGRMASASMEPPNNPTRGRSRGSQHSPRARSSSGRSRGMRGAKFVAALISLAALVTIAVCSVLVVRRQNDIASRVRTEACYSRAQAMSDFVIATTGRIPANSSYDPSPNNDLARRATFVCGSADLPAIPPPTATSTPPPTTSTLPECVFSGQQSPCSTP